MIESTSSWTFDMCTMERMHSFDGPVTSSAASIILSYLKKTLISYNASVTDPADPSTMFVTPHKIPDIREGRDFLFRCLVTDPSVTNLTFQSKDSTGGNGQDRPLGMNVSMDPKSGALIQNVQRSFSGQYVCSGWKDGKRFKSRPVHLLVVPSKTCLPLIYHSINLVVFVSWITCFSTGLSPPSLSISQEESIRLEGENFEVTCLSISPTNLCTVTWTHHSKKVRCHPYVRGHLCVRDQM